MWISRCQPKKFKTKAKCWSLKRIPYRLIPLETPLYSCRTVPLKGLCHQFRSSWKYCYSKATNVAPDIKIFFDSLFNFIFVLEVLMLSLQTHSNYHFYFEYAKRSLCAFKILESNSAWILLVNTRRGESYWLIRSLVHFLLLYRHHGGAKCCSMRIQNVS